MSHLEVKHVSKSFDGKNVLRDVNLELRDGELVCLLGVSGGGKTTLFNVISGLKMCIRDRERRDSVLCD